MVYRVYVEKKKGLEHEANSLYRELTEMLGISSLTKVRLFNRYDVENIEKELFDYSVNTVFSEPQLDNVSYSLLEDNCIIFPDSLTREQTRQHSAFSSSLRRTVLSFARRAFIASTAISAIASSPQ